MEALFGIVFLTVVILVVALIIFAAKKLIKKDYYASADEGVVARVGMKVHVFSPDQKEDWGLGTITRIGTLEIEDTKEVFHNYPIEIQLDNGGITEGIECYWYPLEN